MSLILKSPDVAMFDVGQIITAGSDLQFAHNLVAAGDVFETITGTPTGFSSAFDLTAAGITFVDFPVDAISFNGSTSYIEYTNNFFRDTDMRYTETGNAFTISFWFKPNLSQNTTARIIDVRGGGTNQVYNVLITTDGVTPTPRYYLSIEYRDDNSNIMFSRTPLNDTTIVHNGWNHGLYSAKQLGPTNDFEHNWVINDNVMTVTDSDSGDISNTPTSTTNTNIGKIVGGSGYYTGCLSEIWMKDVYYDLSVESNRRLFISGDSKPVDPPASPRVYLNGSASTWSNTGSSDLGTQTLNNITDCADSPSD